VGRLLCQDRAASGCGAHAARAVPKAQIQLHPRVAGGPATTAEGVCGGVAVCVCARV
jgi:hypothetical protein